MNIDAFADLSQYKILKRIHTSNFSRTTLVLEKESDEMKIMKTIFYTLSDESSQNYFLDYFYKLKSISFPTLLPYQTFAFDIRSPYQPSIILDYYKNGSLYNCCKKLNNTQKTIIIVGIAEGMKYLHHNGFYHGCLEPGNILLDDNLYPIICSYGLSELSEKIKFDVFRCPFALPSIPSAFQFSAEGSKEDYDGLKMRQADDVFAFSMLLYFILKNETPFQNQCENWQQRIQMFIQGSRPQLPSWVPSDLEKLENECWLADAKERPTFKEISHRLRTSTTILPSGIDVKQVNEYLNLISNPENQNHEDESASQSQISVQEQISSQNQYQIPNIDQYSNLAQAQPSNPPAAQTTNVKKKRIFLKYQKPIESVETPPTSISPPIQETPPTPVTPPIQETSSIAKVSSIAEEPQVEQIQINNSIDIDSNKPEQNESELDSYYYIFSDKSDQSDKSDNSDYKIKLAPKRKDNSSPNKELYQTNPSTSSDSESPISSEILSESSAEGWKSDEEEESKIEIPSELLEQYKFQTELGKSQILNGQIESGVQLIKKAADSSYRGAILSYGRLLECGLGVKQDLKQAAAYYRRALKMGSNNAKAAYSRFAMKGLGGVEHNSQAAINLLSKAAYDQLQKWQKKPNLPIQSDMKVNKKKRAYEEEIRTTTTMHKNIFPAKTEAMYQYGKILKKMSKNDTDKLELALKFAQPAAEKDHNIKAMNLYGEIILELGKTKLYPKMAKFFKIAADEGNSQAQYNYGNCRKEGRGVTENNEEAVRYFKMSADQNNKDGLNEYGIALQEGLGIQQNVAEAKKYIKMAADLGNCLAQYNYVIMLQLKIGVDVDDPEENQKAEMEILENLKKASDSDYPDAMILYSQMMISNLDDLSESERMERLKTAKFYLKRIPKICHDDDSIEQANKLLLDVKQLIGK